MRFILILFMLLLSILEAKNYPETFSTIGTPLYKSIHSIEKLTHVKALHSMSIHYVNYAKNILQLGYQVDSNKNKKNASEYLKKLRELQTAHSYILRSTKQELDSAMTHNSTKKFYTIIDANLSSLIATKEYKKQILAYQNTHTLSSTISHKIIKKTPTLVIQIPSKEKIKKSIVPIKKYFVDSDNIDNLGNPYSKYYTKDELLYARNIWDMHVYDGLLFLGAGNSSNVGPAPNAGRVPIISYNPKNNIFTTEGKVAEEQIDIYRTINNSLYIPGNDATQAWNFGNFYIRHHDASWEKFRNIAHALHVYDITSYDDKLFIGIGLNQVSAIGISQDNGNSWNIMPSGASYSQVYSFLHVNESLYATKTFTPIEKRKRWSKKHQYNYFSIAEYGINENFIPRTDLDENMMFPDTNLDTQESTKIIHTLKVNDSTLYLGAYIYNDHQSEIFGAYSTSSLEYSEEKIQKIILPEDTLPFDIIRKDNIIYLLTYSSFKEHIGIYYAHVDALESWKKLLEFSSTTFARSFEMLEDDFYFGLGCKVSDTTRWDIAELDESCGDILRISKEHIPQH